MALKKGLPKTSAKFTIFDVLKNITAEKNDKWYNFSSIYNIFMMNKYISMDPVLIDIAEIANRFSGDITKQQNYDFYRNILPKGSRYFKYIKKNKNDEELLVAEHYGINLQTAKQYLKILTPDQIEKIKSSKDHLKNPEW